jgi:hypothetical protein
MVTAAQSSPYQQPVNLPLIPQGKARFISSYFCEFRLLREGATLCSITAELN